MKEKMIVRKLATIRQIDDIKPIEGADQIELAALGGWQVVVKKDEFKPGDSCVYCEIDSILPEKPEFEFLRSRNFRIKTMKLRGELSQGIAFPLSVLPGTSFNIGDDVTDVLEITKYEPQIPAQLAGSVRGAFPSFIPKTDEERIQNADFLFRDFPDLELYYTEKLDGSSHTSYLDPKTGEFNVCSRNINLVENEGNSFWQIARTHKLEEKLRDLLEKTGNYYCFQGEMIGPGIQQNKYKLQKLEYYVFNVRNLSENRYLNLSELRDFDLPFVPLMSSNEHRIKLKDFDMKSLLLFAEGKSVLNGQTEREGLVFRPLSEMDVHRFGRFSFKAISNKFLLKEKS